MRGLLTAYVFVVALFTSATTDTAKAAPNACATQGPSSPAGYLRPLPMRTWKSITFSNWVDPRERRFARAVRVFVDSQASETATVEVVTFRLEHDCNRYFVENRWQGQVPISDFEDLEGLTIPLLADAGLAHTSEGNANDGSLIDGPMTDLVYRSRLWSVQRRFLYGADEGFDIAAKFERLADRIVPDEDQDQIRIQ